jgi:hypothetical protein
MPDRRAVAGPEGPKRANGTRSNPGPYDDSRDTRVKYRSAYC